MSSSIKAQIHWGIIGCGDVCEVKSGPAFNNVTNSKLVAVMRRDVGKAKDYATRHGVPKYYDSADDIVGDPDVNAIYIATPPAFHEQYTELALKARKPVYVEKPVALNAASCVRMIELEKTFHGKVVVAHYRRALPLFRKVKSIINDGLIGNVERIHLSVQQPPKVISTVRDAWRVDPAISGGGLFYDLSPHQLDIMYWIFGKPLAVSGRSLNKSGRYNAPDFTELEMEFSGDMHFHGVWNFAATTSEDVCEIIGDQGKLRFAFFRQSSLELVTDDKPEVFEMEYPVHIQQPMIDRVVKFFRGEGENPCSLDEALVTMGMMEFQCLV